MKAIILAAGMGTRLAPYTIGIPKPLVPISMNKGIKVVIERLIEQLLHAGIKDIFVVVNYKKDSIMDYLGNGSRFGVNIAYIFQETLQGQVDAMYLCRAFIDDDFVVTDGDNYYEDMDIFSSVIEAHKQSKAFATINTTRVANARMFAILKRDNKNNLLDIVEKPKANVYWENLAKLGIIVFDKEIFTIEKEAAKSEFGDYSTTQLLKHLAKSGKVVKVVDIKGAFTDIGTWDSYEKFMQSKRKN